MAQTCLFTIESKNKKSIFNFLSFFKRLTEKKTKSRIKKKRLQKKRYTKITLLKSPHVHKSAQTQFEFRIYKTQVSIILLTAFDFLLAIKKLLGFSFYDLKITINFFFKERKQRPGFLSLTDFHINNSKSYSNNFRNKSYFWHVRKFKTYWFISALRTAGAVFKN
jgi:ribosomal protein S10